jgi:hypothetical protein
MARYLYRWMDTNLPIVGRRVAKVSVANVTPLLALDLPAWTADGGAEASDYVLEIDAELRFVDSGVEREIDLGEKADPACLRLLGKTVSRAAAFEDGRLHDRDRCCIQT